VDWRRGAEGKERSGWRFCTSWHFSSAPALSFSSKIASELSHLSNPSLCRSFSAYAWQNFFLSKPVQRLFAQGRGRDDVPHLLDFGQDVLVVEVVEPDVHICPGQLWVWVFTVGQ